MSIAIIGAGISGVTTAYFLSKYNFKVDLIESRRYPAMATSYANGGQLSASNSAAWNSWDNIITGIKGFIKKDSPVLLNPMPSLEKFIWLVSFMKNIRNKDHISYEICKMAVESVKLYQEIASVEKIDFDLLNNLVSKKHKMDFVYTGCQIFNKKIFMNQIKRKFSILNIWNKLIDEKKLYGHESKQKFYHLTDLNIFNKLKDL